MKRGLGYWLSVAFLRLADTVDRWMKYMDAVGDDVRKRKAGKR